MPKPVPFVKNGSWGQHTLNPSNPTRMVKFNIVLPTFGSPYSVGVDKKDYKVIQHYVGGGYFEPVDPKKFVIHPMFCEENKRWAIASELLKIPRTRVYVNEDGRMKCCPNMATIFRSYDGCPHLFGDIVVQVTEDALKKRGINIKSLTMVTGDEFWEPDTEADIEAKKTECAEKGWDMRESSGQIYECAV